MVVSSKNRQNYNNRDLIALNITWPLATSQRAVLNNYFGYLFTFFNVFLSRLHFSLYGGNNNLRTRATLTFIRTWPTLINVVVIRWLLTGRRYGNSGTYAMHWFGIAYLSWHQHYDVFVPGHACAVLSHLPGKGEWVHQLGRKEEKRPKYAGKFRVWQHRCIQLINFDSVQLYFTVH